VGFYIAIAIGADDNPIITHYNLSVGDVKLVACSNTTCTSATITAVYTNGAWGNDVGQWSSVAIGSDNNPIISFYGGGGYTNGLMIANCANPTCTSSTVDALDEGSGRQSSIAIGADGNPVISYAQDSDWGELGVPDNALKVAACADTACSSTTITSLGVLLTQADWERGTQIAIGTDDKPVIAFTDSDGNLGLAECSATDCSTGATISTIADAGTSVSLAIRDSDNARIITYLDPGNAMSLKIAVLSAP